MTFRLDSVSTSLAEAFRKSTPANRRRAAFVACDLAAAFVDPSLQEIDAALEALRHGVVSDSALRKRLEDLAARLDEAYLGLDGVEVELENSERLRLFSQARVTSAFAFALMDEPEHLHEAIYEAILAVEDPRELVRAVESALQGPEALE